MKVITERIPNEIKVGIGFFSIRLTIESKSCWVLPNPLLKALNKRNLQKPCGFCKFLFIKDHFSFFCSSIIPCNASSASAREPRESISPTATASLPSTTEPTSVAIWSVFISSSLKVCSVILECSQIKLIILSCIRSK